MSCEQVSAFIFAPARQRVVDQEVRALALHLLDQAVVAEQGLLEEAGNCVADALVVLGAGDRELLDRDAPVQQVPGPGLLLLGHALAQPVGVEAGDQRLGADAPAAVVQPQRRLAGNGRQPVALEMRVGMREAGGVVPHLAGVDDDRPPKRSATRWCRRRRRKGCAPLSMVAGIGRCAGQLARQAAWLPLMPPIASTTVSARSAASAPLASSIATRRRSRPAWCSSAVTR
jgi:hypothetical protein